jgi:uncharacterized protein with HEPN domain
MRSKNDVDYLRDVLRHVELAEQFTQGYSYEAFRDDERTLLAVIRCLEIISEASRRLSDDFRARHPETPWQAIAAAGNFYRHDYEDVTSRRIWKTLREDLPPLREMIEAELKRS